MSPKHPIRYLYELVLVRYQLSNIPAWSKIDCLLKFEAGIPKLETGIKLVQSSYYYLYVFTRLVLVQGQCSRHTCLVECLDMGSYTTLYTTHKLQYKTKHFYELVLSGSWFQKPDTLTSSYNQHWTYVNPKTYQHWQVQAIGHFQVYILGQVSRYLGQRLKIFLK